MKVELLPTAVSGPVACPGQLLTSYLIDDTIAIDAGSLGLLPDLEAQSRVRHVFITHSHIDHIASLPLFLDNVFRLGEVPVRLYAGPETLETLSRHIFNDLIWPDFFCLRAAGQPFVEAVELTPGQAVELGETRVTPVPVDHVIPTLGLVIERDGIAIAISSDTAPTHRLWEIASRTPGLAAVFLEASYPDSQLELARASGHLTPSQFAAEARKLQVEARFHAVHIKPRTYDETVAELLALDLPGGPVVIGEPGTSHRF